MLHKRITMGEICDSKGGQDRSYHFGEAGGQRRGRERLEEKE